MEAMTAIRTLPRWHVSMSDGCSVPAAVRSLVTIPVVCCVAHDEGYYYGGSVEHRAQVDTTFRTCLTRQGVGLLQAELIYRSVRLFGGPSGRQAGVSWAFGGGYFAYSDQPAVPVVERNT